MLQLPLDLSSGQPSSALRASVYELGSSEGPPEDFGYRSTIEVNMDTGTEDLSIRTLIRAVTAELLASQEESLSAGDAAVFEVSELALEISFVITACKEPKEGFDLKVIKAEAGAEFNQRSVHRIYLKLRSVDDQVQPFGRVSSSRPRMDGDEPK